MHCIFKLISPFFLLDHRPFETTFAATNYPVCEVLWYSCTHGSFV
jgi:hypothetical protein